MSALRVSEAVYTDIGGGSGIKFDIFFTQIEFNRVAPPPLK